MAIPFGLPFKLHGVICLDLDFCRFWTHIVMAYAFSFWTCYVLRNEYAKVAAMRLQFVASEKRRPDQYTVCITLLFEIGRVNYSVLTNLVT